MDLIANMLYNEMLGSLPNFHTGSAVAVMMLLPSIISILLLTFLERYNIRYSKKSQRLRFLKIEQGTVSLQGFPFSCW